MPQEDPEALREIPKTWREYISQAKEIINVFKWAWTNLSTPETKRRYRRSIIAVLMMTMFQIVQPRVFAIAADGVSKKSIMLVVVGLSGYFLALVAQRMSDFWYAREREHLLGLNQGMLDRRTTEYFFEKSIGQHVEENVRLNPENISTGRERLLNVQGLMFFEAIPAVTALTCSYVFLWIISPVAGCIMTSVLAICVAWMLYLNRATLETCTPIEMEFRELKRYRVERWKNIERVKVAAKELAELTVMNARFDDIIGRDLKFWLWFIAHCFAREVVGALGLVTILAYGIYLIWIDAWSIGNLFPLLIWSAQVIENIWRIGHDERQLNWNMPGVRSMIDALSIAPNIVSKENAFVLPPKAKIEIVFKGITHAYPLDGDDSNENASAPSPVLKNVSFAIKTGEIVAIIGASGAGKTTLMKLLLRFMDPTEGSVQINGHDLRDIDLASWMRNVSYIPQSAQILDGTLRYNLAYSLSPEEQKEWDDDRLWKLMRSLRIDFGKRLTQGLQTFVGERGVKLSGGQAQRVMIGAAAIQQPPFMVIDEATSSLDSTTEKAVHDGLANVLKGEIGALMIAHRLSTVRDLCKRFVVLRNADHVEDGESQVEAIADSFEELYVISPTFRQLADDQGIVIQNPSRK